MNTKYKPSPRSYKPSVVSCGVERSDRHARGNWPTRFGLTRRPNLTSATPHDLLRKGQNRRILK